MGSRAAQLDGYGQHVGESMGWVRGGKLTGYLGSRAAFAGRDHDEQLHDGVVDCGTAGLDDEDILLSDTGEDLDACLAL